jgi:hypothetical protein
MITFGMIGMIGEMVSDLSDRYSRVGNIRVRNVVSGFGLTEAIQFLYFARLNKMNIGKHDSD